MKNIGYVLFLLLFSKLSFAQNNQPKEIAKRASYAKSDFEKDFIQTANAIGADTVDEDDIRQWHDKIRQNFCYKEGKINILNEEDKKSITLEKLKLMLIYEQIKVLKVIKVIRDSRECITEMTISVDKR